MYLKSIKIFHMQSIAEKTFELPPTGLVVFTGQNSNGKSIVVKTLRTWITRDIYKPRKRASLVDRNASYGELTFLRSDDVCLTLHTSKAANCTYVKLEKAGEEPIVRYLADRSCDEILRNFGWHYDADTGISLNIAEEEDSLLFYKTPNKANFTVLETAAVDMQATKVIQNFEETVKNTRASRDKWTRDMQTYAAAKQKLTFEDTAPLRERLMQLQYYLQCLNTIYIPSIPDIVPVPKVKYVDVQFPHIPDVKYPKIINACVNIPDILTVATELKSLKEHKCPTCGRGFDCDCQDTVHN